MNIRVLLFCLVALLTPFQELLSQNQTLNIDIGCNDGAPGQTRCVTFTATEAIAQLNAIQFVISYDPSVLSYTNNPVVTGSCLTGLTASEFNNNNNGYISFIWSATPAVDLAPGCELFQVCFNIIGVPGDVSPITIATNVDFEVASEFGQETLDFTPCEIKVLPNDFTIVKKYCNPSTAGGSDASINFYGIGGVPGYTWILRRGAMDINSGTASDAELINIPNLTGGTYTIIMQDFNGITRMITFSIPDVGQPTFEEDIFDPSCFSTANGKIKLKNINVLNTPYQVKWSNGVFNQDSIENLRNGDYTVSVVDANGCAVSKTYTVFADTMRMQVEVLDSASCKGLTDGTLRITVSGGTPNPGAQPYQLDVNQLGNTFIATGNPYTWTNAPAGWVSIQARDYAKNYRGNISPCTIETKAFVPFRNATDFNLVNLENVACFGESTGKVEVKAGGTGVGTSFIMNTYYAGTSNPHPGGISGPMGVHLNNTLASGDYCIYSRSNIGCRDTFCFTITQPSSKMEVSVNKIDPSCIGLGSIQLTAMGGVPGYTYQWSDNGPAVGNRANLPEGIYRVTVTDVALCDTIIDIELKNALGTAGVSIVPVNVISCKDGNDGVLKAVLSSSPTMVNYSWLKKEDNSTWNTETISNLSWGTYFITVTVDGCVAIDTFYLLNPEGLVITDVEVIQPECPRGGTQGSLGVSLTGGFPTYNYRWTLAGNPGNVLGVNSVLAPIDPGTYNVIITDQKGCAKDTTLVLNSPPDFTLNVSNIIAESCNGDANGKATALAAGGPVNNGQYKFFWSSGEMSGGIFNPHSAQNLAGGRNWVFVTDSKCVSDTVFFDVASPPAIVTSYEATGICAGGCTGQIDVTASGGTGGALSVSWPSIPFNGSTVFNLCAGSYPFVVTDGNGCSFTDTVIIAASDTLKLIVDDALTVPLSCRTSIGQLALIVDGGTPIPGVGYTYNWSPNVSQSNLATDLVEGQYRITVTDQNGCTASLNYTMERPNPVKADIANPIPPLCSGGTTCIQVSNVMGGVPGNYTMQINNGLRIPVDSCLQLFAGDYLVSIYDASGCKTDYPVTITQPDPIQVALGEDIEINLGEEIGIITPFIESELPIVNYQWSGLGDLSCTGDPCTEVSGIPSTDLTILLVVSDENGCTAQDILEIKVKDERRVYLPNIFLTSGQEANRLFDIKTGYGVQIVESFYIYDRWGNVVYSNLNYIPDATTGWDGLVNGQQALPGVYVFTAAVRFLDGQVKTYRGDVTLFK